MTVLSYLSGALSTFSLLGLNCLEHFIEEEEEKDRTSREASSQEVMRPWQSLSPVKGEDSSRLRSPTVCVCVRASVFGKWTAYGGQVSKCFAVGQGYTTSSTFILGTQKTQCWTKRSVITGRMWVYGRDNRDTKIRDIEIWSCTHVY